MQTNDTVRENKRDISLYYIHFRTRRALGEHRPSPMLARLHIFKKNVSNAEAFGCICRSCDPQLGMKAKGYICLRRQLVLLGPVV